ncbi:MAG: arylsulfatase [Bryobacterales bacterium]|nr:arylsulfatase [Bryobacterales bacterium]
MRRRDFFAAAAGAALTPAMAQATQPNIILILADDLGYGDLGCYGQRQIQTPHLDRMASEGVRFTQAYAGSTVCAPSRCAYMTGLHTGHCRTRGNRYPDLPLRPQDWTITELLRDTGYRTGIIGKWSLGNLGSSGYPTRKGADTWFGFFSQGHAHNFYPEHLLDGDSAHLLRGNFGAKRTEYAHDLFTDRALAFIADRDPRPFFLHLAYTIPHANNEMGRDTGDGMEVPSYGAYADRSWPNPEKGFAAMIARMDADIGRLFEQLKRTGKDRDTVVIFSSDNGPHQEGGHSPKFFESSGPLKGIKRDLYEGGIRVPTIARWPGRIPEGKVSDAVWAHWDLLPTCAELAGVNPPRGLDGRSAVKALMGGEGPGHEYLYWEFHERGFHQAIRHGDWKGVRFGRTARLELYNLAEDIGERNNLAAKNPEIVKKLEALLASARVDSEVWPVREKR